LVIVGRWNVNDFHDRNTSRYSSSDSNRSRWWLVSDSSLSIECRCGVRYDDGSDPILYAVARGRREAIITGHGKILVALNELRPGSFAQWAEEWPHRRNVNCRRGL
jgi:hypothetical protein